MNLTHYISFTKQFVSQNVSLRLEFFFNIGVLRESLLKLFEFFFFKCLKEYIFAHIHHPTVKRIPTKQKTLLVTWYSAWFMFWFPSVQTLYITFILLSCTVHQLYEFGAFRKLRRGAFQPALRRLCACGFAMLWKVFGAMWLVPFHSEAPDSVLSIRKHFVLVNHGVSSQMRHIGCRCMDLVVRNENLSLLNGNQCLLCHGNLSAWSAG